MTDPTAHLPHRSPLLMVDRVLVREPGVRVVAEKRLGAAEPLLERTSILPGPFLVEMLAQAGGFLEAEPLAGRSIFLAGMKEVSFSSPARAGDCLRLEVTAAGSFGGMMQVAGRVSCDERELCRATLLVRRL